MPTPPHTHLDLRRFREVILFLKLSDAEIERVKGAAHPKALGAGEFCFLQGDPAEQIYLLINGRVKLTQAGADGQQVLLRLIGPYMLFGGIALAHGETYPITAQAAEDSLALCWPKTSLMPLVAQSPQMALNALQMMAGHVQEFQERFRQLATERVERRLARSLLRLASQAGKKVDEGVLINLPLSRQDLAEMNGTTLYTVSRLLSQWETRGLVICGREKVIIRFPHGLVSVAEDLRIAEDLPDQNAPSR